MKGLMQMETRFFRRATMRERLVRRAKGFRVECKRLLYVLAVLQGVLASYRRKGYFDFEVEQLIGCSDSIIYFVRYWHPRCICRIIHRFPNGYGAIVTVADWSARKSSFRKIIFPMHGSTWFEVDDNVLYYWHLTDIMKGVAAIEALESHPDDGTYETRVAKENRVWPELWIRKNPPTSE